MITGYLQQKARNINKRPGIEITLFLSCSFSVALVLFRIIYTHQLLFIGLIWNLFLAFLPFFLSNWIYRNVYVKSKWSFVISIFIWLLLIPNAFYIITDLFHLKAKDNCPLWYDLALLYSFAWNGLLFGILSVRQMEKMFNLVFNKNYLLLFIAPVMFLNSLGIYIGRFLRFNSWDVISNPILLTKDIYYLIFHPFRNRLDWGMIICYAALMTIIYISLKKLSKELV